MASPPAVEPFLRLSHSISERIMCSDFTENEIKILLLILRLSWGCNKEVAYIPYQSSFEVVGIRRQHIKPRLKFLVQSNVIFRLGLFYQLNRDFDHWFIFPSRLYRPEKMGWLVKINLDKSVDIPPNLDDGPVP